MAKNQQTKTTRVRSILCLDYDYFGELPTGKRLETFFWAKKTWNLSNGSQNFSKLDWLALALIFYSNYAQSVPRERLTFNGVYLSKCSSIYSNKWVRRTSLNRLLNYRNISIQIEDQTNYIFLAVVTNRQIQA